MRTFAQKVLAIFILLIGNPSLVLYSQDQSIVSNEFLALHIDRDIYIAGEEVAFSLNLIVKDNTEELSQIAYLVLRNANQSVIGTAAVRLKDGIGRSSISLPDTLSTGYYQIIAFTNFLRNYGDDFFAQKQFVIANRFDKNLDALEVVNHENDKENFKKDERSYFTIETNKTTYQPLEVGSVSISGINKTSNGIISLAIVPVETLLFDPTKKKKFTDNHISSKGLCYPKELDGFYISGRILDEDLRSPILNARLFLSTPDTIANLKYTLSDSLGNFVFHLSFPYSGRDIFVIPDTTSFQGNAIVSIRSNFDVNSSFIPIRVPLSTNQIDFIKKSQDIVLVHKLFNANPFRYFDSNGFDGSSIPRVYSNTSNQYLLSDYEPLSDFSEIAREIIPSLRIRRRGGDISVSILNSQESYSFFSSPPAIFLNGMPINSIKAITSYGSTAINRIEIISVPWHFGELVFNGVLSVFLNKDIELSRILPNNFGFIKINPFAKGTNYVHFSELKKAQLKSSPDFRQLLLWEPCLNLGTKNQISLDFLTSHLKGDFVVVVKGYSQGEFFIETSSFTVN